MEKFLANLPEDSALYGVKSLKSLQFRPVTSNEAAIWHCGVSVGYNKLAGRLICGETASFLAPYDSGRTVFICLAHHKKLTED